MKNKKKKVVKTSATKNSKKRDNRVQVNVSTHEPCAPAPGPLNESDVLGEGTEHLFANSEIGYMPQNPDCTDATDADTVIKDIEPSDVEAISIMENLIEAKDVATRISDVLKHLSGSNPYMIDALMETVTEANRLATIMVKDANARAISRLKKITNRRKIGGIVQYLEQTHRVVDLPRTYKNKGVKRGARSRDLVETDGSN